MRRAELDFAGVDEMGHSFADGLFRVLPATPPQTALHAANAEAPAACVIEMVRAD